MIVPVLHATSKWELTMDMDDDDDFMGKLEFDLTPEQSAIVRKAIMLAADGHSDEFMTTNPLIAIMQWWETNVPDEEKLRGSPERTLAEACRLYVLAHDKTF
jgi:hypothetical protein